MTKRILGLFLLFIFLVPFVNALTGSIGNAKAIVIVDLSKSKILERTVLVKNVNNISVDIKLEAADDLEGITEILDKEFVLKSGEEKNARFKVTIPKEGNYNGNIAVFFKPFEGKGAGVALQSNLIIKAVGKITNNDPVAGNKQNNSVNDNLITGNFVRDPSEDLDIGLSFIILIILIVLIVVSALILVMRKL